MRDYNPKAVLAELQRTTSEYTNIKIVINKDKFWKKQFDYIREVRIEDISLESLVRQFGHGTFTIAFCTRRGKDDYGYITYSVNG